MEEGGSNRDLKDTRNGEVEQNRIYEIGCIEG